MLFPSIRRLRSGSLPSRKRKASILGNLEVKTVKAAARLPRSKKLRKRKSVSDIDEAVA
jgi:hypothetical protein